jgi:transcriptional regulator with XRE-family HTH domain
MVTRTQIRMARTALGWGVRDLAEKTGLSPGTVSRIEMGKEAYESTVLKIRSVLEEEGIDFPDRYTVSVRRLEDRGSSDP